MTHSHLAMDFAHEGVFRGERTAPRRHHSSPSLNGRFIAGNDANTKAAQNVKPLDRATERHVEEDPQLDGSYEDDLAEVLRRSKLGTQSVYGPGTRATRAESEATILAEAGEANLQNALRMSKGHGTLESGPDAELQLALELSRIEAGHNEQPYDPDTLGETSRMGEMRNNGGGGVARASVPDLNMGRWNDSWDEPPPPCQP